MSVVEFVPGPSNRPTLADLERQPIGWVAGLAVDELAMLADDIAGLEATAKKHKRHLNMAVRAKYSELAKHGIGTVRVVDGDYDVVVNIPKNVTWDNAVLARIETEKMPDDRYFYQIMEVKRSVTESVFATASPEVARVFEEARTVKAGSQTVKFERKERV